MVSIDTLWSFKCSPPVRVRMSLQSIPVEWRQAVIRAIRARRSNFTELGRRKWDASFPGGFKSELEDDLVSFLNNSDARGCPVTMDSPLGITWEFWFRHRDQRTYGKLMLEAGTDRVLIFSAHLPERPKLRCED